MSTEATQTGADVVALEDLFVDPADDLGNGETAGNQVHASDTQGEQEHVEVEIDPETGEPVVQLDNADGDPDLTLELDANAANDANPEVLVVPDDHKVTLEIDGQNVEMTFSELKANVQMRKASEKRFEEAATIRKEYTEKAQGLGQREQQLGQVLDYYIKQSNELMQSSQPNWEKLIAEDPQKYLTERHNWEIKQRQLMDARQVQANLQAQAQREAAAAAQKRALEARTELVKAIPEWSNPQKLAAGAQQIDAYLANNGISHEMRSAIDSAQVLLIARKAMLYDAALAKQAEARRAGAVRVNQAQPAQGQVRQQQRPAGRVERPGAATAPQSAASRANLSRANATKAFNANPSVDTLAALFE